MKKEIKATAKEKVMPMDRINTRITNKQHKFIKEKAKLTNKTEGEIFRSIIDTVMKSNKI